MEHINKWLKTVLIHMPDYFLLSHKKRCLSSSIQEILAVIAM